MSHKFSRRRFMKRMAAGALALASLFLMAGCTRFDAEYGKNDLVSFTDKNGASYTMYIEDARLVAEGTNTGIAEKYQLETDEGQRYAYIRFAVTNGTDSTISLYKKKYDDEDIREHFYDGGKNVVTKYPVAENVVDATPVFRIYNNGSQLINLSGVVCYTGAAGEPSYSSTYAKIPTGQSYIDCIAQVTDQLQTLRIAYRFNRKEVNFVLKTSDLSV